MATSPLYEQEPAVRVEFHGCPLCGEQGREIRKTVCGARGDSPRDLTWMRCTDCEHVYAKHYFVGAGRDELLSVVAPDEMFGGDLNIQRLTWSGILNRILARSAGRAAGVKLVDVGVGNGGCLFTAAEMGFDAIGIDVRPDLLRTPRALGYHVELIDAMDFDYSDAGVVVLADILEHVPFPRQLLRKVRSLDRALFVSCPNMDSVSWKYMDKQGTNIFWMDQEHYHNFTRASLERLLRECGFSPVEYAVSSRYQTCMELIAV